MKRLLLAGGIVAAIAIAAVGVLRWRETRKREEYAAKVLPEQHDEAFVAADECEAGARSLRPTMAVATSRFSFYVTTDRRLLAKDLADVVTPIISSRQTACEHARSLLEIYMRTSPVLDTVAIARLAHVHAHILRLEGLAAAMQATRDAITAGATDDELRRHLMRLRMN